MATHYNDPIDQTPGRLAGNSRNGSDASPEVIAQVQQIIINEARNANLSDHEIAYVLAIAEKESGFNPDAANKTTSAFGLGQTINATANSLGLTASNRWDATAQAQALIEYYQEAKAQSQNMGEGAIYQYYHDGPSRKYDGIDIYIKSVAAKISKWEVDLTSKSYGSTGYNPYGRDANGNLDPTIAAAGGNTSNITLSDGSTRTININANGAATSLTTSPDGTSYTFKLDTSGSVTSTTIGNVDGTKLYYSFDPKSGAYAEWTISTTGELVELNSSQDNPSFTDPNVGNTPATSQFDLHIDPSLLDIQTTTPIIPSESCKADSPSGNPPQLQLAVIGVVRVWRFAGAKPPYSSGIVGEYENAANDEIWRKAA